MIPRASWTSSSMSRVTMVKSPQPVNFVFHFPAHLNQLIYGSFGLDNEVTLLLPEVIAEWSWHQFLQKKKPSVK
jgi:hypothetical protein